jgi:hypothetical protein
MRPIEMVIAMRAKLLRLTIACLAVVGAEACTVPGEQFVAHVIDAPPIDAPTIDGPMGPDAPPACTADSPCCDDSGQFRGAETVCATSTEYQCANGSCGGRPQQRTIARHCNGTSAACEGEVVTGDYEDIPGTPACGAAQFCSTDGTEAPTCVPCPGGCANNTCAGVECTGGACCTPDGQFKDPGTRCATSTEYRCNGMLCGGQPQQRTNERRCTGTSAVCDAPPVLGTFQNIPGTPACGGEQLCLTNGTAVPVCDTCQFGCENNACEGADCTSGACCDGGRFRDNNFVCSTTTEFQCGGSSRCAGAPQQRMVRRKCSGSSEACNGVVEPGAWNNISTCAANEVCTPNGASEPSCVDCPFGCSGNVCQAGTLWVFPSTGSHQGNFGGRAFADEQCTIAMAGVARDCNQVRAVLGVSASDSLAGMAARYGIPTDVEVRRPDATDTLVAPHWNALIDRTFALTNPVSTAAIVIWSGEDGTTTPPRTCNGWTSRADTVHGVTGNTVTGTRWLFRGVSTCNNAASFACVCWNSF